MPLLVGVENGIKKGFTEEELDIINGFAFGCLMMSTETGSIEDIKEFRLMALEMNFMSGIFNRTFFKEFLTEDMVTRMKDADWYCNVGRTTKARFNRELKRRLYAYHQNAFREYMEVNNND